MTHRAVAGSAWSRWQPRCRCRRRANPPPPRQLRPLRPAGTRTNISPWPSYPPPRPTPPPPPPPPSPTPPLPAHLPDHLSTPLRPAPQGHAPENHGTDPGTPATRLGEAMHQLLEQAG